MQNEVKSSKLVFLDTDKDEEPQWKTDSVPPLLGGWRSYHASVAVKDKETDQQTVVVIGGYKSGDITNSVLLMNLGKDEKQWNEAPYLNQKRRGHAAVVCNGFVYVLGGFCNGCGYLNSIERIAVDDLLETTCTTNNKKQWTTLNCRLSTPRNGCAAVVVHDRFIVVAGGYNGSYLSSTDIIDTVVKTQHTVIAGPSMKVARRFCAMAVVDRRIFVVGGHNGSSEVNSVEYLEFNEASRENNETAGFIFPSSSEWTVHNYLVLSVARHLHAVVTVGFCLIVAGGKSAEVLDTKRNVVFNLPDMTTGRCAPSMVSMSDGIAVIGGQNLDSSEALPLIDLKDHIKNLYSCRAELDTNIEKLSRAIEHANLDSDNEQVLKDAIEAESVLPLMQSLRDRDDKFRSVHELKEGIDQLQKVLKEMNGFKARLPVAKKIQKLKDLVALGGYDLESCETFELSDKKKQIKNKYSCRAELDKKIQKLHCVIERAHKERRNVTAVKEAIEAQSLLPLMEWLRDHDEKFRSVQELAENNSQLEGELQEIDILDGYLPIARKIEALEKLVAQNKMAEDERNHDDGHNAEDESESGWVTGNETLPVSDRGTVELSDDCDGPEDRILKLEDMIVELKSIIAEQRSMMDQLSVRLRLLENPVHGENET